MRIALFQPDIPQNTGTILRLCALPERRGPHHRTGRFSGIRPTLPPGGNGLPRSGKIVRHASWRTFENWRREAGVRLLLLTTKGSRSYLDCRYDSADILLLGRESAGVPDEVFAAADEQLVIPMQSGMRSLNVAMAAAMALGEALRQTGAVKQGLTPLS